MTGVSTFKLGILVAVQTGAFLFIGLPAGVWLDRRRSALIATDLVRAGLWARSPWPPCCTS